jgi:hypothetical protein
MSVKFTEWKEYIYQHFPFRSLPNYTKLWISGMQISGSGNSDGKKTFFFSLGVNIAISDPLECVKKNDPKLGL